MNISQVIFGNINNSLKFIRFCRCYCQSVTVEELKKPASKLYSARRFIDKIRIHVRGGSGGQGSRSTGGIGGKGGSVFIKCVRGSSLVQYTLLHNRRIIAGHGSHYIKGKLKVDSGSDVYISVPPGTEIKSGDNVMICDMNQDGEVIKLANGGAGGSAKTPDFNGQKGERKNVVLELKTIADASLTGFPNAGKSSLLRAISRALPKVGDYPFTTINPMVGSIFYSDSQKVVVADLPGLIEDAHLNKGMGHKFLRHIERTKVVVLVIDVNGFQLKNIYRTPVETLILLLKEIALYKELILGRPFLLVLNKMDTANAELKREEALKEMMVVDANHHLLKESEYGEIIVQQIKQFSDNDFKNVFSVSAMKKTGLDDFKLSLYKQVLACNSD